MSFSVRKGNGLVRTKTPKENNRDSRRAAKAATKRLVNPKRKRG